jgi:hypothetical protein
MCGLSHVGVGAIHNPIDTRCLRMIPATEVRVLRDSGSAAGQRTAWKPVVGSLSLVHSLRD